MVTSAELGSESGHGLSQNRGTFVQHPALSASAEEVVDRETRYFEEHRDHVHYQRWRRSGSREEAEQSNHWGCNCNADFRTCGQFWKRKGLTNLLSVAVLFKN